jgi:hypothetical protein
MGKAASTAVLGSVLLCWLGAGCTPKSNAPPFDPAGPYVGTWRMPTSGATWAFAADGTCSVNGTPGTYTEANGTITISGKKAQSVQWRVSADGKQLTLIRTRRRDGKSMEAQFERQ